ncbi:MAG: type II secretion system F family protein [Rhodospirillaceae bacterium]|nr:type II secretion system F family protein [Rhodospirillaceae bacterium]
MSRWLLESDPATINLVIVAIFMVVMGGGVLWFFFTRGEREMKDRIERIAKRPRRGAEPKGRRNAAVNLRKTDSSIAQLDKMIKQFVPNPAKLRGRLARTGKEMSLGVYVLFSLVTGAVGVLLVRHLTGLSFAPALLIGILIGLVVPHLAIGFMIGRRKKKFLANFPDAIEVLIRGLKAGLPATESMRIVGQEMNGPVAEEFLRITDALRLGGDFDVVLWSAADRINLPEFNFFVITLSIQRETGGNLGETLENLTDMLRKRRQVRLKVKALSSEAKASAIIIGSLPFALFGILYLLNRDYVMMLFNHPTGPILVGVGFAMQFIGIAVMAKLVKFEI